ncbi:hypothetical protein SDC9_129757 [bioreactor metagenome]|uniref:HTH cro/C1-type domain-containing protein n=1 Tax=bioreactor metagenome TaxID=1076179 RepID=A0A645D0R3_9ZZZZ
MIGKEICARRKRMGLTQRELARLVNVKANTMSQYENGMRKVPLDVLAGVARVLKCTVMDLAYEEMGMAADSSVDLDTGDTRVAEPKDEVPMFADPLDNEIVALLKDLDQIAKEKVITYMRDQKVITGYYRAVRERR